jgi:hypothetical protein
MARPFKGNINMRFLILIIILGGLIFWAIQNNYLPNDFSLDKLPFSSDEEEKKAAPATPTQVYKWQDENGNWQFGDKPPEEVDYESTQVEGVQSVPAIKPQQKEEQPAAKNTSSDDISFNPLMPITDPGRVKQLIDDAKNIQGTLEQRKEAMDKQI